MNTIWMTKFLSSYLQNIFFLQTIGVPFFIYRFSHIKYSIVYNIYITLAACYVL